MNELELSCKFYEQDWTWPTLPAKVPGLCRIDGRAFRSFTRDLQKPFDSRLSDIMVEVCIKLVKETGAIWGFTASDEISLCLLENEANKIQKIASQTASVATYYFNKIKENILPEKLNMPAFFDSRVWSVPDKKEALNYAIWRQQDCVHNSISMAASAHFSHKELMGLNSEAKQEKLIGVGINWNNYPSYFKWGTFIIKNYQEKPIPPEHLFRGSPLTITRSVLECKSILLKNDGELLFGGI